MIQPLTDRFRIILHLDFYSHEELGEIVRQRCRALAWEIEPELLAEIAKRAKGTPRIALRLLQSSRRMSSAEGADKITVDHLRGACEIERVSDLGLDNLQQKYLHLLGTGPVRLGVLASMLGVGTKVLTKTVEPYCHFYLVTFALSVGCHNGGKIGVFSEPSIKPWTNDP